MQLLETAINKYLALDPETPAKLAAFDGKAICLDVLVINRRFYLLPGKDQVRVRMNSNLLRGVVVDPDGRPVEGVYISAGFGEAVTSITGR